MSVCNLKYRDVSLLVPEELLSRLIHLSAATEGQMRSPCVLGAIKKLEMCLCAKQPRQSRKRAAGAFPRVYCDLDVLRNFRFPGQANTISTEISENKMDSRASAREAPQASLLGLPMEIKTMIGEDCLLSVNDIINLHATHVHTKNENVQEH